MGVVSFRWFGFGWDSAKFVSGIRLVQWGRRKDIKFFLYTPKEEDTPKVVYGPSWVTTYSTQTVRAGYTGKPINFSTVYGGANANRRREGSETRRIPARMGQ
jgi:hypothetical protein